jgi:acetyl esterase/lipase
MLDDHNSTVIHTPEKQSADSRNTPGKRAILRNLWALITPDAFESPTPTHKRLVYRDTRQRGVKPLADVYLPKNSGEAIPSVFLVHGGAFLLGSRSMKPMRFLAGQLRDAGFAVCSIDYRLIFRGGRLEEARKDVSDGLLWWRDQADKWALDLENQSILGLSAGASLALLVAGDPALPTPQKLVCGFGLYDFETMGGKLGRMLPQLLTRSKEEGDWRRLSPLRSPQPDCPTLLLHGDADQVTTVEQTHALAAHRHELGLDTRTRIYPQAPHGFFSYSGETTIDAMDEIVRFLKQGS